ncbi:MAG: response regulator [Nitrospirae bacterium]|nr:MAG: response regulator [Nitrospirota bacterium]
MADQLRHSDLLSKGHTILERPFMLFRPFGEDERGEKIEDIGGMVIRDNVEFLEECVAQSRRRQAGATEADAQEAGAEAVRELCRLLNARIRDPAYHVTPAFLKKVWNGYSYEFSSFLREFCQQLSGDPQFHYNVGQAKHISPLIQTLGRPFPLSQIHKMYPYFAHKFAKGLVCTVVEVTDRSAILRLQFAERTLEQFGPYRRACAVQTCESSKGRIAMVPTKVHNLPQAKVKDRTCIVEGDDYCEWEVTWTPQPAGNFFWSRWGLVASVATFICLRLVYPDMSLLEVLSLAMVPALISWLATARRLQKHAEGREALIQEQIQFVEARHEELRDAYLVQEQTSVKLNLKVSQLTALHRAASIIGSTLDRETLLPTALQSIISELHYDRAMITFYDRGRQVLHDARILGVPAEVAAFARTIEVPVTDPNSVEGMVVFQKMPVLVKDVNEMWGRLHPLNQQLATITKAKSIISVPLHVKHRVIGTLTVDRIQEGSLTKDDLDVMVTLANQIAIALDNADVYRQIESLNVGLEAKVRERTAAMERFLARVSHDLRTPLTSMTGFAENMLAGLTGPLAEKQRLYLARIIANGDRLGRLVDDLLDMLLDPDQVELSLREVNLPALALDVVEQLRPLTISKQQRLEVQCADKNLTVWADADKLNRIVTNLVDNAIKYTGQGGCILVKVEAEGPHFAKVSVSDTGEGIPADALPKVFDSSFRVNRPEGKPVISHRLGLSIVKDLVERHGGRITAHSEVGKGSEFSFTVPRLRALKIQVPPPMPGTKRLLVADDDSDIRQLLSDRLTSDGYIVQTASDGQEALAVIRSEKFDGLILDIGMPGVDGLEVLCKIREKQPMLPVIMITAAEAHARALVAMQAGAQAFLLKPFDAAQLKEIVVRWVGPSHSGG